MAVRIVEPEILQCAWCRAPRESLIFVRSHRTPRGKQIICSLVYHCRHCGHQTGTIKAEPFFAVAGQALR